MTKRCADYGSEVATQNPIVISYEENVNQEGKAFKQITGAQTFSSYQEAVDYISSQESGNYRIVSDNPYISPVPLPALKHFRLVYASADVIAPSSVDKIPQVKIFEYVE